VDVALAAAAVAITANLTSAYVTWIHERHRSARVYEMAHRLPPGSRYAENTGRATIEIGQVNPKTKLSEGAPE
jgi:hypothetical protein